MDMGIISIILGGIAIIYIVLIAFGMIDSKYYEETNDITDNIF